MFRIAMAIFGWSAVVGVIGILLFSYLLPQDLQRTTEPYGRLVQIAFFGRVFTFHLGLGMALVCAVAACVRRWRLMLISGLPALLALLPATINCLPKHPAPAVGATVRIMSANLKYFNRDGDRIIAQIRQHDPQVLMLEDYTPFSQDVIDSEFANDYPYRKLVPNFGQGLAIYSRMAFDDVPRAEFGTLRRQMRAVIRINGSPVALYIVHPYSPRTRRRILLNRQATADIITQVAGEKIPVVLAGDFNFTAETPNQSAIEDIGLRDAFDLAGIGRGSTWPMNPPWLQWLPGVRIDHISSARS